MQALKSTLYSKPPITTFFEDDFSKVAANNIISGTTPSGGSGHWADASYSKRHIKKDQKYSRINANARDSLYNTCYAVPDLPFGDRIRVINTVYVRNNYGCCFVAGSSIWNTTEWNTGITTYIHKPTSGNGCTLCMFVYDNTGTIKVYESTANHFPGNAWLPIETHVEKLSSTRIKIGLKHKKLWVHQPTEQDVKGLFTPTENKIAIFLRNTSKSSFGGHIMKFKIDDQVEW